jgi:four helix bundle protein
MTLELANGRRQIICLRWRLRKAFRYRKTFIEMRQKIKSFTDLEVYQNTYSASIVVLTKIIPKMPKCEQYDLTDQLRRSVKAIPRLIAEGYAKRHQAKGFQKYLDDAAGESNETIVSLSHVKDVYKIEVEIIDKLLDIYDKTSRQLYNLSTAWESFTQRKTKPKTDNETPFATGQQLIKNEKENP